MSASTRRPEGHRQLLSGAKDWMAKGIAAGQLEHERSVLPHELFPDNGSVMAEIAGEKLWVTLRDRVIVEIVDVGHPALAGSSEIPSCGPLVTTADESEDLSQTQSAA